jgi:hypothetical protein
MAKGDKRYREPAFWLVANSRMWAEEGLLTSDSGLRALRALATEKLTKLCDEQETGVYTALGLAEKLGGLGEGATRSQLPRQDENVQLALPAGHTPVGGSLDADYLMLLHVASTAIDERFKKLIARAVEIEGGRAEVDVKHAHPKGKMRMAAKLAHDHANETVPRAACNVDVNRMAWVLPAERMAGAYAAAEQVLGPPIRVKNGYHPDNDARERSFGYRSLLVNYLCDAGCTWGELASEITKAAETVTKAQYSMLSRILAKSDERSSTMRDEAAAIEVVAEMLRTGPLSSQPARLVAEIQYITPEYMAMRMKAHLWYKIIRSPTAAAMQLDFIGGLSDASRGMYAGYVEEKES